MPWAWEVSHRAQPASRALLRQRPWHSLSMTGDVVEVGEATPEPERAEERQDRQPPKGATKP